MRDFFGMVLVLALPVIFVLFTAALVNPKWFKRANTATSRKYIALAFATLLLSWVLAITFASGAGGSWYLGFATLFFYLSLHAYSLAPKFAPEPVSAPLVAAAKVPSPTPVPNPTPTPAAPVRFVSPTLNEKSEQPLKNSAIAKTRDQRTLAEIAQDIISDGMVTLEEAQSLRDWFEQGERLKDKRAFKLYQWLCDSLRDNELSHDESTELLRRLRTFAPIEPHTAQSVPIDPVRVSTTDNWKGLTINCTYETAAGDVSDRRLKVLTDNGYSIYCYCHMRGAKRTFVKDRVVHAVDVDSGEVLI